MLGKADERDAEPARQRRGPLGGRDADDRQPSGDALSQRLDDAGRGRAGAEAEHHPALDELDGAFGGGALQAVEIGAHPAASAGRGGADWRIALIAAA